MKPGLVLLIILIFGVVIIWLITVFDTTGIPFSPDQENLTGVEVREYQGVKLNEAGDFRENSIKGPQKVDPETYRLSVYGLVTTPLNYTYQDVIRFPSYQKVVTLHCVEGWDVTILWKGVQVRDILSRSEIKPSANTIIFHAVDGYSTSFPLNYVRDNPILMAYYMNNQTLSNARGFPFQLVAEDKWGYKWIKWIMGIEITDDPAYEGYWETRGFSNSGDLNKRFF